ncbi:MULTISPECIES: PadR family transcriptional regulator [Micrococcaceae]|uniref:PadR family transcriptional regulator n=1 Tax=Micrococcaceae TaxID=1268 RepID=UPI003461FF01
MEPIRRVTAATVDVLSSLLSAKFPIWGLQIVKDTDRRPGSVYPILERLESSGWLVSHWEEEPNRPGPRRRLYCFSDEGRVAALETVSATRKKAENRNSSRPAGYAIIATSSTCLASQ